MPVIFRKLSRVAAGVALLVPFATCTDFTGPKIGRGVRVPVAPTFSKSATFAKAVYAAAGIEFDRVRVLIVRGEAEVLKDTTVAFSPSSADLTLPLLITANPGEVVTVTLEYRSVDIVLYSGSQAVTTVAPGASPSTPATPLVLIAVGPGSAAASVELSPASGTFPVSSSVPFTATAFTQDHSAIANAIFAWTVEDATVATVNAQGIVQPTSKGGSAKVRATTLNGKFAEATITFVTPPASLATKSGGGQSGMALEPLANPVVVKVLDANGVPVPGATVNFATATGGGSVTVVNGVSDASGLVSANWTLGETVGTQSITATATALPNAPITINATATERPAKALVFGQQPLKSLMNASITPAVTVKALDDKGHVVSGYTGAVTIALEVNPTTASLGGTTTVNAVGGVATFSSLTLDKAGEGYQLKATATGLTAVTSEAFGIDQVPSGLSLNAGGSQTKPIKSVLDQIVVKVADANGLGVAGETVTFEVVSGGGSIVVNNGTTDADGLARVTWTLGSVIGEQSIRATSGTLNGSPLTIKATGTALPAVALAFEVQPSTTAVGTAISPAVKVKAIDAEGNLVTTFAADIALTLANANGASLGGITSVAAVNGVATFSNLSVDKIGSAYKLSAASGSLVTALSGSFIVTPGPAVALVFKVPPANVVKLTAISPPIEVKIVDAQGNTVTDATNAVALGFYSPGFALDAGISGNDPVNAVSGVATFNNVVINGVLSSVSLKATAVGLAEAISAPFAVTLPPGVTKNWTGAISTSWSEPNNWSPIGEPGEQDSVTILAAANQPLIETNAYGKAIVVESGATLQIRNGGSFIMAEKVVNKGTLVLTAAFLFGSVQNHNLVVADSFAYANAFSNLGSSSKLRVSASRGTSLAEFGVETSLTNAGEILLEDTNGQEAQLYVPDSLLNTSTGVINVVQGSGGGRTIETTLINQGALNVTTTQGLYLLDPNINRTSVNAGTMTFTNGGPLYHYFVDSTLVFKNTGTIAIGTSLWEVLEGTYDLKAGTITGTGQLASFYAKLDIDFSKFPLMLRLNVGSRFPGDSLYVPAGQTAKLYDSNVDQRPVIRGTLQVRNSTGLGTDFIRPPTLFSGGVLDIQDVVTIDSAFTIPAGAKMTLNASGQNTTFTAAKPFTNAGTIELTSTGGAFEPTLSLAGTGALTNASGAFINVLAGSGGQRRILGRLVNNAGGTVSIPGTTNLILQAGSVTHSNAGTITLSTATAGSGANNLQSLSLQADVTGSTLSNTGTIAIGTNRTLNIGTLNGVTNASGGTISGTGSINKTAASTSFSNAGTIAPGTAGTVGTLTFQGNLTMAGTLDIDLIGGSTSGNFDRLTVTGTTTWGGGSLFLRPGASVPTQQTWVVVTATSFSGTLPTINLGSPWGGPQIDLVTNLIVSNAVFAGPVKPPMD